MDESGFNVGVIQVGRRVIDSTCNINYRKEPGRQEWVTVVECICANGSSISPLVIFKGEKLSSEWIIPADPAEDCDSHILGEAGRTMTSVLNGERWILRAVVV